MAEIHRYVDPDVSWGLGNGTSWANAYSSLADWNNAEATDLVSAGNKHIVHCRASEGSADTDAVTLMNWTTSAACDLTIQVDEADRHDGVWDDTKYRLVVRDALPLYNVENYVNVYGLQLKRTYLSVQNSYVFYNSVFAASVIKVGYCIAIAEGSNYCYGFNGNNSCTVNIFNCISKAGKAGFRRSGSIVNAYNCTAAKSIDASYGGFEAISNCKNCVSVGNAGADFHNCASVDHCASDDGTGTNAQTLDSTNDYENEFSDYPGDDYSLVFGSCCIETGTDDPGSGLYSDDIARQIRSTSWDIGAFEYIEESSSTEESSSAAGESSSSGAGELYSGMVSAAFTAKRPSAVFTESAPGCVMRSSAPGIIYAPKAPAVSYNEKAPSITFS